MTFPGIKRALISVSNKLGLLDFARGLTDAGVEVYSTGGTRRHLETAGIDVHDVSDYTGFPEMMDGRLKTLHPKVFGGILARRDRPDDMEGLADHDIVAFDLVVVNLYPFEAAISRPETTQAQAVEQIDIGGPSLVRAAAKNFTFVTIATRPEQYSAILQEIENDGATTLELRRRLMTEAFEHTAAYDRAIADYFAAEMQPSHFPQTLDLGMQLKTELRYGENPHQKAALYRETGARGASLVTARQINGKELSYNNLLDLDAALTIARSFADPACAVIKHSNPCGGAVGETLAESCRKGLAGDPLSAFGSVIGFNRTVDVDTANLLAEPGLFVEGIVAPDFSAAAVGVLTTKPKWKKNVRLMQVGRIEEPPSPRHYRYIDGGMLVQDADIDADIHPNWKVVTQSKPSDDLMEELKFAWRICRFVKSNAIVIARDKGLCGVGAGQMSRVDSVDIAIKKAEGRLEGSVLASDAFFPFPDSIEKASAAGIAAIIQPGGSRNDEEVITACNKYNLPMIFTNQRHFRH